MVVKEMKRGNTIIRIHDDYIVSEEEAKEILRRISSLKEKAPAKQVPRKLTHQN